VPRRPDDRLSTALDRRVAAVFGGPVAGVDEAGRGPLAGPLVVAAVILPPGLAGTGELADSKRLAEAEREALGRFVRARAQAWAVWRISPRAIDRDGMGRAWARAVVAALAALPVRPAAAIIDGPVAPRVDGMAMVPVVDGDRLSASVMAAALVAKTARDGEMRRWHGRFPAFGFDRHKGYATPEHRQALGREGPCPIHRRSFLSADDPA